MDNFFINMFRKREAAPPMVQQREVTAGVPSSTNEQGSKVTGGSYQSRIIYAISVVPFFYFFLIF